MYDCIRVIRWMLGGVFKLLGKLFSFLQKKSSEKKHGNNRV